MKELLKDEFSIYFEKKYPIIFKNKITKKDGIGFYYSTAIDNAMKNN